jgi:hypothetical protein
MTTRSCPREQDVQAAAMSGRWPPTILQHATECAHCRDLRRVVLALQAPVAPAPRAADASALWVCGRHARRISTEARISTVVAIVQIGMLVGVLGAVIAFASASGSWTAIASAIALVPGAWLVVSSTVAAVIGAIAWRASMANRSSHSRRSSA